MIKSLKAAAIGLPIVAAALFVAPGAANAAPNVAKAPVTCDVGEFCAWTNDGFTGGLATWSGNSSYWGTMSDNAESIWNRHRSNSGNNRDNVQTYFDANYGGGRGVCVLPDEQYDTG